MWGVNYDTVLYFIHVIMENGGENIICRLCFDPCECTFEHVETVTIQMLGLLGLELELNVSGEPVICKTCSESLEKCFDFKTACLYAEDCINSFRDDGNGLKLDLREVYVRKNENEYIAASKCRSICRLCMEIAESGCHVALNDLAKDTVSARTILEKYFLELDLNVTEDPVICISCSGSLYTYFNFMKKCLNVVEETKMYCKIEGSNNKFQGEPSREMQFSAENIVNYRNDCNNPDEWKSYNWNALGDKVNIKLENLVQKELQIKREVNEYEEVDDNEAEVLSSELQCTSKNANVANECYENEQNYENEPKSENFVVTGTCGFNFKYEDIGMKIEAGETTGLEDSTLSLENSTAVTVYQYKRSKIQEKECVRNRQTPLLFHKKVPMVVALTHQCAQCDYKADCKDKLDLHMRFHNGDLKIKVYQCDVCLYETKYSTNLQRHKLVHKSTAEVTIYSCEICTFKSKHIRSLKTHMLVHKNASEVTLYSCEMCTYKGKRKKNLERHMLVHKNVSEVKSYSCAICIYKAKRKECLERHMRVHQNSSQVKTYSCEICAYKSKEEDNLKKHMLSHKDSSEITTYHCGRCTFKTRYKNHVKRHMMIHERLEKEEGLTLI